MAHGWATNDGARRTGEGTGEGAAGNGDAELLILEVDHGLIMGMGFTSGEMGNEEPVPLPGSRVLVGCFGKSDTTWRQLISSSSSPPP